MNDNEERPELQCSMCDGTGHFTVVKDGVLVDITCDMCDGEGWIQ